MAPLSSPHQLAWETMALDCTSQDASRRIYYTSHKVIDTSMSTYGCPTAHWGVDLRSSSVVRLMGQTVALVRPTHTVTQIDSTRPSQPVREKRVPRCQRSFLCYEDFSARSLASWSLRAYLLDEASGRTMTPEGTRDLPPPYLAYCMPAGGGTDEDVRQDFDAPVLGICHCGGNVLENGRVDVWRDSRTWRTLYYFSVETVRSI